MVSFICPLFLTLLQIATLASATTNLCVQQHESPHLQMTTFAAPASTISSLCVQQYEPPHLRYPPYPLVESTISGPQLTPWLTPELQDLFGTYIITHSSRASYQSLTNLRAEHYPVYPQTDLFPPGSEVDIVSWSSSSSSNTTSPAITTVFGWFRPLPDTAAVWKYTSTGPLINTTNLYALLGVGVDTEGVTYRVDYETGYAAPGADVGNAKPCINVAARQRGAPSEITFGQIVDGLKILGRWHGDERFVALVDELEPLRGDGRRDGEGPVVCDGRCVDNMDLVPV